MPSDQIYWQLGLDQQGITELYVDANFAIVPIGWQLELDQGITEFYVDATFTIRPVDKQLELDQGVTDFHVDANFAGLAIWLRPGGHHWFSRGHFFALRLIGWQLELVQGVT